MKKTLAMISAVFLLTGCSSVALVQKDEWERHKADLEELKVQVENLKTEIEKSAQEQRLLKADLSVYFSDLKGSMNRVSGQVEASQYDLKNLNKTTEKLSERKYIIKGGNAADSSAPESVLVSDKMDVQKLFKIARQDFNAKDYDRADKEFADILSRYPKDDLAGECVYWMGEGRYVRKQYKEALTFYDRVGKEYPVSTVAPPALYKTGLCLEKLKDDKGMKKALNELIAKYPQSDEAGLAKARLGN